MTMFQRHSPAIAVYFIACLAMAIIYAMLGTATGITVLPESYGPIVYAMPMLAWAGMQALFSAIGAIGAAMQRPIVTALGAFPLGILFITFAVASVYGGASEVTLVAMAWPAAALAWLAGFLAWGGRNDR